MELESYEQEGGQKNLKKNRLFVFFQYFGYNSVIFHPFFLRHISFERAHQTEQKSFLRNFQKMKTSQEKKCVFQSTQVIRNQIFFSANHFSGLQKSNRKVQYSASCREFCALQNPCKKFEKQISRHVVIFKTKKRKVPLFYVKLQEKRKRSII